MDYHPKTILEGLILMAVDKVLFAGLLILAGYLANKALERFKDSLAWGAEILRQKLSIAKEALPALSETADAHLQFCGGIFLGTVSQQVSERFLKSIRRLEEIGQEARLLLAPSTVDAIFVARSAAMRCMDGNGEFALILKKYPVHYDPATGKITGVTHQAEAARQAEVEQLQTNTAAAIAALQTEFPAVNRIAASAPTPTGQMLT